MNNFPLRKDGEEDGNDYDLVGEDCWIGAGAWSLHIMREEGGDLKVKAYINGREVENSIHSFVLQVNPTVVLLENA
jgi:malate synthase